MKIISTLVIALLSDVVHFTAAETAEILSTELDFQKKILDSFKTSVVFYTAKDKDTVVGEEIVDKLKTYDIETFKVDCSSKANKKICKSIPIPSAACFYEKPTLNPYTRKNYRSPFPFQIAEPNLSSIEKILTKVLKDTVTKVKSIDDLQTQLSSSNTTTSVLLFSTKETIPMFFRSIAHTIDSAKFYFIPSKSGEEIMSHYKITSSPSVAVLASPDATEPIQYSGSLSSRAELISFVSKYLPSESGTNSSASSTNLPGSTTGPWMDANDSLDIEVLSPTAAYVIGVFPSDSVTVENENFKLWRDKAVTGLEGNVKSVLVKCGSNKIPTSSKLFGNVLCNSSRTQPYLYVLPYTAKERSTPTELQLGHAKELLAHEEARVLATDSLPRTFVRALSGEKSLQEFLAENQRDRVLSVLALSSKTQISPLLHNLALTLSSIKSAHDDSFGFAQLAFMGEPPEVFLKSIGNPKLPTVIIFFFPSDDPNHSKPGGNSQMVMYDPSQFGPPRHNSLYYFIRNVHARTGLGQPKFPGDEGSASGGLSGQAQTGVTRLSTNEDWERECSNSYRGICAIALLSKDAAPAETEQLTAVAVQLGSAGSAFKFMSVEGHCQKSFAQRFDVTTDLPAMVAFSAAKNRFATYRGAFKQAGIKSFLESVLSGSTKTVATVRPNLSNEDCKAQSEATLEEPLVVDEDASDLLEEIRREEKEKQMQLKKEAEEAMKKLKEEASKPKATGEKKKGKKKGKKSKKSASSEL